MAAHEPEALDVATRERRGWRVEDADLLRVEVLDPQRHTDVEGDSWGGR